MYLVYNYVGLHLIFEVLILRWIPWPKKFSLVLKDVSNTVFNCDTIKARFWLEHICPQATMHPKILSSIFGDGPNWSLTFSYNFYIWISPLSKYSKWFWLKCQIFTIFHVKFIKQKFLGKNNRSITIIWTMKMALTITRWNQQTNNTLFYWI